MVNKVDHAIIMAAGYGTRMRPLTDHTPKPLITVNGTPLIESVINGLHANGIQHIYIVVGYLKDAFNYLANQDQDIHLITNPYYQTCNNIASLYMARDYIANAIILDGDQEIYDPQILQPCFNLSGYNAVWTDHFTNEWLLTVNHAGIITHCSRNGGSHGYRLYSVSRWNTADGLRLKHYLTIEMEQKHHTQLYWDDVALFQYPQAFKLGVYPMKAGAIAEFDSIAELAQVDHSYDKYL